MTLAYLGRRNRFNGPWSTDRQAQLVALWGQGFSATQIARLIGDPVTRLAVLAKARRLGLPRRPRGRRKRMRAAA